MKEQKLVAFRKKCNIGTDQLVVIVLICISVPHSIFIYSSWAKWQFKFYVNSRQFMEAFLRHLQSHVDNR